MLQYTHRTERLVTCLQYGRMISASLDYIEEHIKEELTAEQIAGFAGYSVYHFCRIFCAIRGLPVMDYVRLRRLSLAGLDLKKGRKVIDVALDWGFETAGGFSKAFRRAFGCSPSAYASGIERPDCLPSAIQNLGGKAMQPIFKTLPPFKVAGYGIKTNMAKGYTRDLGAYWEIYTGENMENRLYAQLCPPRHGEIGICIPGRNGGDVTYLLGVVVEDFSRVTPDMMTVEVQEATYAVFTTPPVDLSRPCREDPLAKAVQVTWKAIFQDWFPSSGYQYEYDRPEFEFYDERCHGRPDSVAELYIPIKSCQTP